MTTGVLALQGAFAAHQRALAALGEPTVEIRRPEHLEGVDRLVVPGGESTTISMLAERAGLLEPIRRLAAEGTPVLGTCAGAILLSSKIIDGRADQVCLGLVGISTRRNGFGRQRESFTQPLEIPELGEAPFPAVCIRAPLIEDVDDGVEVLATLDGRPAMVRQGAIMVTIFHPELAGDERLHQYFLGMARA